MKKLLILIVGSFCVLPMVFGGGIVTNTNQSASYVRMLIRDASTRIDAVYFNPAGLVKLDNGFHFSINSQTALQSKDVTDDYQFLDPSPKTFLGDLKAPVFPGVYAVWKAGNFAVSFGFNPVGGGGGAEYKEGLPSFETRLSDLVPILAGQLAAIDLALSQPLPAGYGFDPLFRNITGYGADIYFKGTSVYFGYQGGLSYKINQFLGVYAGVRFVTAKNTYKGDIKNVMINAAPTDPPLPLYDVPAGDYTPGNYLRAVSGATGLPAPTVALLNGIAAALDAQTTIEADAEEKGNGYTPILGANISLGNMVNIGLKYEFKTKLELTQTVHDGKDAYGMFVQDSTVHSDMPAMISAGVGVNILPNLSAMAGLHYYFDRDANYGKTLDDNPTEPVGNDKVIDKNTYEIGLGLEFNITPKLLVSGGYLFAKSGVSEDYQSDISFDLSSNSAAFGLGYKIIPNIMVNLGFTYVKYKDGKKDYTHIMETILTEVPATQTYVSDIMIFGIGVDVSL